MNLVETFKLCCDVHMEKIQKNNKISANYWPMKVQATKIFTTLTAKEATEKNQFAS